LALVRRFDVHEVDLDPAIGSEIRKRRPCLVISPDEMNAHLRTVIVAPMTSHGRAYPTRVSCRFAGIDGWIVLDQVRTVDRTRLVRRLGRIDEAAGAAVSAVLTAMYAP
jgi:mRNA interferase MazF